MTHVTSRLDYSCGLFYGINKDQRNQLQRLQNTAARLVCKASRYEHSEPLWQHLHWLPVEFGINFRILMYVFKYIHNKTPVYINELLEKDIPVRDLRSNTSLKLKVPKIFTKSGEKMFAHAGPTLWNSLPISIKTASTIASFKRLLKTFYFKIAYKL